MTTDLTGGCLCGAVRYQVTAEPRDSAYCHCRMCQRRSGAPAVATAEIPSDGFAFTRGEPAIYQSSDWGEPAFCAACGTEIFFAERGDPPNVSLNVGTLDDPEAVPPRRHIWTSSQLSWFTIADDLPRFAEGADD